MKLLLVLLLLSTWCSRLLAVDDAVVVPQIWKNPNPILEEIVRQIPGIDPNVQGNTELSDLIQTMAYAINQEIMAAESPDWAHPSPARKVVIERWGKTLDPFSGPLVDLALGDTYRMTYSAQQSRSLLDFAAPTEKFASEVRRYMVTSDPHVLEDAAGLLFEHRLISPPDQDALRQLMSMAKTEEDKTRYALILCGYGIDDWKEFLLDKANGILTQTPTSNEPQVLADYYSLPLAMAKAGFASDEILTGLLAVKSRLDPSQFGLHLMFDESVNVASGRKSASQRYAKNGSGPLGEVATKSNVLMKSNGAPSTAHEHPRLNAQKTPMAAEAGEEASSSSLWPIMAVLFILAIGLVWWSLNTRR